MPMSGAVFQRRTPDPMGREEEHRGNNGNGETQAAVRESEGGTANTTDATDATREGGDRERRGKIRKSNNNTFGGEGTKGGEPRYTLNPGGSTSPEVYGDSVYVNPGTHLDRGIRYDSAWKA